MTFRGYLRFVLYPSASISESQGCWKADWWHCQAEHRTQLDLVLGGADSTLAEGLHAYVEEHAYLELSLVAKLEDRF